MNILPSKLRDRAKSLIDRTASEAQAEEARKQERAEKLRSLAIEEFKMAFEHRVSKEIIEQLNVEYESKPVSYGTDWVLMTYTEYRDERSGVKPYAIVRLPESCWIKIWGSHDRNAWQIEKPTLQRNNQWTHYVPTDYIDIQEVSVEELLLITYYQWEQQNEDYLQQKEQREKELAEQAAERERQRIADEQYVAEVETEDAEIRQLIEQAIAPYHPQWKEGFTLQVYKWRYCTGAADGEFDYEEVFSLSPHMQYDRKLDKSFVVTVEGDRIALESEIHKPVIREVVCDSLESAYMKLGRTGFSDLGFLLVGVNLYQHLAGHPWCERTHYWQWEEDCKYPYDRILRKQIKPWLRKLLGLPEVPSEIQIQKR